MKPCYSGILALIQNIANTYLVNSYFIRIIIVVSILASLLVFQATATNSSTVFLPSELADKGTEFIPRVRIGGRVSSLPIEYITEPKLLLKFRVYNPGGTEEVNIPVEYAGLKPDMFAPGRDVIIEGEFKDGVLYASNLLTQCPSKYKAPEPTS